MSKHCLQHILISEKDLNFLNNMEHASSIIYSQDFQCRLWGHSDGSHWALGQQPYLKIDEKWVPGWWIVWNADEPGYTILTRDSCPAVSEDGDYCSLPIDHSVPHKWLDDELDDEAG